MKLNIHHHTVYKFLLYQYSSSHVQIAVCPGADLETFYPPARPKLIQTNLTEPDIKLFMNLTH